MLREPEQSDAIRLTRKLVVAGPRICKEAYMKGLRGREPPYCQAGKHAPPDVCNEALGRVMNRGTASVCGEQFCLSLAIIKAALKRLRVNIEGKRALFICPGGLGDVILASPAFTLLREALGEEGILHLLVENRAYRGVCELFLDRGVVAEVKVYDFKGKGRFWQLPRLLEQVRGYDITIASGTSPLASVLLWLSGASCKIGHRNFLSSYLLSRSAAVPQEGYASLSYYALVRPLVGEVSNERLVPHIQLPDHLEPPAKLRGEEYIVVHPGTSQLSREKNIIKSPDPKFWMKLLQRLMDEFSHWQIVLVGGPDDRELRSCLSEQLDGHNFIDLSQEGLSLMELGHIVREAQAFLCVDSGPMHLGVAVGAKVLSLFGPTDEVRLLPPTEGVKSVVVKGLLCRPCLFQTRSQSCALPLCIGLQDVESTMQTLRRLVEGVDVEYVLPPGRPGDQEKASS